MYLLVQGRSNQLGEFVRIGVQGPRRGKKKGAQCKGEWSAGAARQRRAWPPRKEGEEACAPLDLVHDDLLAVLDALDVRVFMLRVFRSAACNGLVVSLVVLHSLAIVVHGVQRRGARYVTVSHLSLVDHGLRVDELHVDDLQLAQLQELVTHPPSPGLCDIGRVEHSYPAWGAK